MWHWFRRLISKNTSTSHDELEIQAALGTYKKYSIYLYSRRGSLINDLDLVVEMEVTAATKASAVGKMMKKSPEARKYCPKIFECMSHPEKSFDDKPTQVIEWITEAKTITNRLVITENE